MLKPYKILFLFFLFSFDCLAQQFEKIPVDEMFKANKKIQFREIQTTSKGDMLIISSMYFAEIYGNQFTMDLPMGGLSDSKGNPSTITGNNIFNDAYYLRTGFKSISGGPDDIIYLVSDNNNLGWIDYKKGKGFGIPPFNFPGDQKINIKKIWLDRDGDLFIAASDTIYLIEKATILFKPGSNNLSFKSKDDKNGNTIMTEGAKVIRKFSLGRNVFPYCFAIDPFEKTMYIGTNKGIFEFEKKNGESFKLFSPEEDQITITDIHTSGFGSYIWFSTLEKGMGAYNRFSRSVDYFPYKKEGGLKNPIQNFTSLSTKEFLVALEDSLPAVFNTEVGNYEFINDTSFAHSKKNVIDIKIGAGNITVLIMDGDLYISRNFIKNRGLINNSYPAEPYLREILVEGKSYRERLNYQLRNDSVRKITLEYYENHIDLMYAARGVSSSDTVVFAWKLDGLWNEWQEVPLSMLDERMNMVNFDLKPGSYAFRVKMKTGKADWSKQEVALTIIIRPPFWQIWWFWAAIFSGISLIVFLIVKLRVRSVRNQERLKAAHEKELLELEAKALRAQMNPHFVFNCLNSIKTLMQENQNEKGVTYLTTFSKLIRTLFNNADKKEISLYDEIETCKFFLQLEAMRFDEKFSYSLNVNENIDLKSVPVPALIIQPFIENAIWHGIVPRGRGNVILSVSKDNGDVQVIIEDDGIGREASRQNKSASGLPTHQSKGVNLTQSRLKLDNLLQQRRASIETIDKKDESGKASGTKVILTINEET